MESLDAEKLISEVQSFPILNQSTLFIIIIIKYYYYCYLFNCNETQI